MKQTYSRTSRTLVGLICVTLVSNLTLSAQARPDLPARTSPPEPEAAPVNAALSQIPEPPGPADPLDGAAAWQVDIRRAQAETTRRMKDVARQLSGMHFGYAGPNAQQLLVIPSVQATDENLAASRDDLAIMSTILARAANPDKPRRADLLLEIDGWRSGAGREFDGLMLDGFGALFLLNLDYPLVGLTNDPAASPGPKSAADTTWEKTRREVLGRASSDDEDLGTGSDEEEAAGRSFDRARVAALEKRLIEALRHASNLRGLTPQDWIIVRVTGRSPLEWGPAIGPSKGNADRNLYIRRERHERAGTSVLTLRVRKSAVDDLAANRTKLEDFTRAVEVTRRLEKPPAPQP